MGDLYEKFAFDYDEFGPIEGYLGAEKEFFARLLGEAGAKTVLDCACGTGQHLYMLAQLGYTVTGSDYSAAMLEVAAKNLAAQGMQIPLSQCDFRFLETAHPATFDAVLCLTSALPHLHTDADLLLALTSMKNRLNPGGLLVLTSGTTHYTLGLPPIEVVINRPDFSRVFVKEQDGRFQTIHVLDLYHGGQRTEENQYDIVYRILLDGDYRRLLAQAGFATVEVYGDYEGTPYTKDSRRMVVVARALAE